MSKINQIFPFYFIDDIALSPIQKYDNIEKQYDMKVRACLWFFRKRAKNNKMFENFGKNIQIWKYFEKGQPHVCDYHMHEAAGICPAMVENKVAISVMQTETSGFFKWPNHKDKINYYMEPAIAKIDPPTVAGNQEHFTLGYFITQ